MSSTLLSTSLRRMAQRSRTAPNHLLPNNILPSSQLLPQVAWLGTPRKKKTKKKKAIRGSKGSRGHGWYIKYREGRGGRHLQGEYWDRNQHHWDMQQWNDAVFSLGSQYLYLDIAVEPPATTEAANTVAVEEAEAEEIDIAKPPPEEEEVEVEEAKEETEANKASASETAEDENSAEETKAATLDTEQARVEEDAAAPEEAVVRTERLILQVASTVMPETCINFIGLCQEAAYKDSILYRIEKEVGICGGDVLTNTGQTGQCWQSFPYEANSAQPRPRPSPLRRDLPPTSEEPMALWHVAGTVTMLCPKVDEIDSRFLLCGKDSPHLDGIHRAFGKLEPESLAIVQEWQNTVLTSYGKPKSVTLKIVDCGVLEDYNQGNSHVEGASQNEGEQVSNAA